MLHIVHEIVKNWGLPPADLNSKECFFEADKRRSAFLRGRLQESGGVVGEMWPDSQVGSVRPAFPTFSTEQRLLHPVWPFPRPVLIFSLCRRSALPCFLPEEKPGMRGIMSVGWGGGRAGARAGSRAGRGGGSASRACTLPTTRFNLLLFSQSLLTFPFKFFQTLQKHHHHFRLIYVPIPFKHLYCVKWIKNDAWRW